MKTLVIVIGAGHSGSTLLSKTLNAHSDIFALSEIANFGQDIHGDIALCGCGVKLSDCPFWETINTKLKSKLGYGIKEQPGAFNLRKNRTTTYQKAKFYLERNLSINLNIRSSHYKNHLQNIKQLYATLFDETGTNVLVDSSKSPKRAYLLKQYLKKNYNVKIIHLVRDGRAVLYSYLKGYYKVRIKNPETGDLENKTFFSNHKRTEAESINIWKKDNKQALLYHNSVFFGKNGYYFMRYEDFANYPEKELNKLLNFIGVEYETEMLNLKRYENHMVSGNASRINAQSIEKPFEGWKEQLTEKQLDYFNRKAKKLNQKFGYQK